MCSRANSNQLHTAHKLIARNNVTVKQETDANGDILLYNVEPIKGYELGDVVSCDSFGVGVYSGSADSDHIILFVSDGELLRVIKGSEEMKIRRSMSHYGDCFSDIGGRPIFVDFSQSSHAEFGLYPCDVIRANSQTAFFVGVSTVDGKERAVFSTEFLMKNGFGVGYFEEENFKEKYELIARITKPGKRVKKLSDGRNIELSVDTNDFINQTLLPGDELLVHERHCEVCGISEGQIYVEYHDNNECAALEAEPKLLYRRISVPTKAATAVGECWIDITHCADSGFLPQDKVVYNGKKYKIIGVIDKNKFCSRNRRRNNRNREHSKGKLR
ncbi:uncharacterized protein GO595_001144 [Histomonas meleagridis]|uniref:uncharacterized protein n=1 Tax=Histomonas meleagridis TaxID=135588 RepID=UPI003559FDA7|nr:hypothetical protein GO595_001144 [Histomonas meleagridis]